MRISNIGVIHLAVVAASMVMASPMPGMESHELTRGLRPLGRGADFHCVSHLANMGATRSHRADRPDLLGVSGQEEPQASTDAIDKIKVREIVGIQDDDRRIRKFLELVVLPFGVCFLLITLLRRGFLD